MAEVMARAADAAAGLRQDQSMKEVRIVGVTCGHCLGPMRGFAYCNDIWLCHPDEGLDCYRLVTVYRHSMPCNSCISKNTENGT